MTTAVVTVWRAFYFLASLFFILSAQAATRELPDFSRLVAQHGAAVVNISVTRYVQSAGFPSTTSIPATPKEPPQRDFLRHYFDQNTDALEENSLGSGFIVSADGYILTCAHVVENAREILVRLNDRREFSARVVGTDKRSDVALLKIESSSLPVVAIGDANKLQVGEWVLAIGSPFGFDSSATAGIVSAKGRTLPSENYVSFIQTDVPINPGNSGGPLFNLKGEVVGVNSQIYSDTGGFMGLSFAIPIDSAMKIGAQLKNEGKVRRGWLGVSLQEVSRALAGAYGLNNPHGALVTDILPNSPAAKSDLRPGDIVLEYEGKMVNRSVDLAPLVGLTAPGTLARFDIFRRDQGKQTIIIKLGELREEPSERPWRRERSDSQSRFGLTLGDMTPAQRKNFEIDQGAYVTSVDEGPVREAGLRVGDVILEVDGKRVSDASGFFRLLEHMPAKRSVVLRVRRGMTTLFMAFAPTN
ncbi:MAG: Do family serine endopeptidase [Gammaproteobacteria bacterium]|nr:Do family serine endopeptidase [Gammaproteobacteria bacterium]